MTFNLQGVAELSNWMTFNLQGVAELSNLMTFNQAELYTGWFLA